MKNDTINLILICIAYFSIGLLLAGNYIHDNTLKQTQKSLNRLIIVELITEQQFNLLHDRIKTLERNFHVVKDQK